MKKTILFLSLSVFTFFISCQSDYDKMLARETASGIRKDSLFWTLKLNMPSSDFFKECLELNHQKILVQADGEGKSILHTIGTSEMKAPTEMYFFPVFNKQDKVIEMPVMFQYESYSPFSTDFNSEKLLPDVLQLMERWYGKGFIKIEKIPGDPVYAKIDGNRRILIRKKDDAKVSVVITDLTQKK